MLCNNKIHKKHKQENKNIYRTNKSDGFKKGEAVATHCLYLGSSKLRLSASARCSSGSHEDHRLLGRAPTVQRLVSQRTASLALKYSFLLVGLPEFCLLAGKLPFVSASAPV